MPRPFDQLAVALRHVHQFPQSAGVEAVADSDANLRFEPWLGFAACSPHVEMKGLPRAAFVGAEEEESEALVAEYPGHEPIPGKAPGVRRRSWAR
jgi:hypothetical protein